MGAAKLRLWSEQRRVRAVLLSGQRVFEHLCLHGRQWYLDFGCRTVGITQSGYANTGSSTLNINNAGAKPIRKSGTLSLVAGDLPAGQLATLVYDGAAFQIQSLGLAGPAGPAIGGILTTKGDTVTHNGTAAVRMGVCPDGQAYIADSTQTSGWRCGAAGGSGSGQGIGLCAPQSANGATYTCSVPGVSAYTTSLVVLFRPDVTSTGPATVNINSLGAKSIMRSSANGVVAGELVAGTPYLLSYDGVTFTVGGEQLEPDGSGTVSIRRDAVPRTIGVTPGMFGGLTSANVWTGSNDFTDGFFIPPQRTVSNLPAAGSNNKKLFIVTDGATTSDCTTGGGSHAVMCRSNGTAYAALTGGTSGGSGSSGPTNLVQLYPAMLVDPAGPGSGVANILYNARVIQLNTGSAQSATWWAAIPANWSGVAPSIRIFWANSASDAAKTYNWVIKTSCDATGTITYNAPQTVSTNDTATGFAPRTLSVASLGLAGCTAGAELRVQIGEGAAGFTSLATHYLKGMEITWPLN